MYHKDSFFFYTLIFSITDFQFYFCKFEPKLHGSVLAPYNMANAQVQTKAI